MIIRKWRCMLFFCGLLIILALIFIMYILYPQKSDTVRNVKSTVETNPVHHIGDTADDVCVWINPNDKWLSLIIGDDKDGGLCV